MRSLSAQIQKLNTNKKFENILKMTGKESPIKIQALFFLVIYSTPRMFPKNAAIQRINKIKAANINKRETAM
jgi:hypothetical protein